MSKIKFEKISRGRASVRICPDEPHEEILDVYESSSICPSIWIGVDKPRVRYHSGGKFQDVALAEGTHIYSTAHLSIKDARNLIRVLQRFVDTGRLPTKRSELS